MGIVSNEFGGLADRVGLLEKLGRVVERLGVTGRAVRARPLTGSSAGMELRLQLAGTTIRRVCDSQQTREANFGALVQWAEDLARNAERGIEQLSDALHGDGASVALRGREEEVSRDGGRRVNLYGGQMTAAEAWRLVQRSTERLGLDPERSAWLGVHRGSVTLRLDLGGRRVVEKRSVVQADAAANAAALALWLQCRARHHERGIDRDLARVMSAYLLPEAS
jgi:hypothetical protein